MQLVRYALLHPKHYALIVFLLIPLLCSFCLSFSKNFRCSSLLSPFNICSRSSFFFLSSFDLRSSALSSSSTLLIRSISSWRAALIRFITSGRKCACETRKSGRRRKAVNIGKEKA